MSSEDEASSSSRLSFFHCHAHVDYLHIDLKKVFAPVADGFASALSVLHGLSAQQVPRQQCIDWSGTPHDPSLLSAGGSPQARILLHATPKQLSASLSSA